VLSRPCTSSMPFTEDHCPPHVHACSDIHIGVHGLIVALLPAMLPSASARGGIRKPRRAINVGGETPERTGERSQRWAATEKKSCVRNYSSRWRAGAALDYQLLSLSAPGVRVQHSGMPRRSEHVRPNALYVPGLGYRRNYNASFTKTTGIR
jgi:hypothetical protein